MSMSEKGNATVGNVDSPPAPPPVNVTQNRRPSLPAWLLGPGAPPPSNLSSMAPHWRTLIPGASTPSPPPPSRPAKRREAWHAVPLPGTRQTLPPTGDVKLLPRLHERRVVMLIPSDRESPMIQSGHLLHGPSWATLKASVEGNAAYWAIMDAYLEDHSLLSEIDTGDLLSSLQVELLHRIFTKHTTVLFEVMCKLPVELFDDKPGGTGDVYTRPPMFTSNEAMILLRIMTTFLRNLYVNYGNDETWICRRRIGIPSLLPDGQRADLEVPTALPPAKKESLIAAATPPDAITDV